jgi:hypothetical protein
MTDLERNFEKAQARLAELEESLEAAEAQVGPAGLPTNVTQPPTPLPSPLSV